MAPIRKGDGTGLTPKGIAEVRKGDGTVLYSAGGAIPDSGLARWTLDDADTSGGSALDVWGDNDATINGATTGSSGANQTYTTNEAYSFDGVDDNLTATGYSADFGTGPFSVAFWIFPDNIDEDRDWVGTFDGSTGWIAGYRSPNQEDGFRLFIDGNDVISTQSVTTGVWQHLIYVRRSDDSVEIFLDGSSIATGTLSADASSTADVRMMERANGGKNQEGELDDVRLYDKGLDSSEASSLYSTGSI